MLARIAPFTGYLSKIALETTARPVKQNPAVTTIASVSNVKVRVMQKTRCGRWPRHLHRPLAQAQKACTREPVLHNALRLRDHARVARGPRVRGRAAGCQPW